LQAAAKRNGAARVLEVGGGTAATTSYLISALRGHIAEYVFTDIGAGFVSAAKHEFDGIDGMRFQTLDLEQSPAEQGLDGQSFDIIVASNVLHATADLRQTCAISDPSSPPAASSCWRKLSPASRGSTSRRLYLRLVALHRH